MFSLLKYLHDKLLVEALLISTYKFNGETCYSTQIGHRSGFRKKIYINAPAKKKMTLSCASAVSIQCFLVNKERAST